MAGITELDKLLTSMSPQLQDGEYVFCTVPGRLSDYVHLNPLAVFAESEGLTLIISPADARKAGFSYEGIFRQITLTVHSSLDAVGLTAAVSTKLADHGLSANVVAAYYHDHIFVRSELAQQALSALKEIGGPAD